jgi:hypothetical protein
LFIINYNLYHIQQIGHIMDPINYNISISSTPEGIPIKSPSIHTHSQKFTPKFSVDVPSLSFKANLIDSFLNTTHKVYLHIQKFFSYIKIPLLGKSIQFVADLIWPYQKKEETTEDRKNSIFGAILQRGLKLSQESALSISPPVNTSPSLQISAPITAMMCVINHGIIPYQLAQNYSNQSLVTTVRTAVFTQNLMISCCNNALDKETLKKYDLIPEGDSLDHYLFQGTIILVSKGINLLTPGNTHQSLHFAIALLGTFPPLQNAAKRSYWGNQVSQKSHQLIDHSRQLAKKPLVFVFKKAIRSYLQHSGVSLVNKYSNTVKNEIKYLLPETSSLSYLFGGRLESIAQEMVDHHISNPIIEKIPALIDKVADTLAGVAIDQAVLYTRRSFEVYFCNQALSLALKTHPVLASMTLIAEGGIKQNLRELLLRVSGVGVMLLTGSTFWPMLIIHVPQMVDYTVTLRGNYLKKQGVIQDPIIEVIKKFMIMSFTVLPPQQAAEALKARSNLNAISKPRDFPKDFSNPLPSTTNSVILPRKFMTAIPTKQFPKKAQPLATALATPFPFIPQLARNTLVRPQPFNFPSFSKVVKPQAMPERLRPNILRMQKFGNPLMLPRQDLPKLNHPLFKPASLNGAKPLFPSLLQSFKK